MYLPVQRLLRPRPQLTRTFMDASMSTVPTRRSSVTPSGICTNGASRTRVFTSPLPSFSARPSWLGDWLGDGASAACVRRREQCKEAERLAACA